MVAGRACLSVRWFEQRSFSVDSAPDSYRPWQEGMAFPTQASSKCRRPGRCPRLVRLAWHDQGGEVMDRDVSIHRVRRMLALSTASLAGLVVAVAMGQTALVAVPIGVACLLAYLEARAALRSHRGAGLSMTQGSQAPADRGEAYELAYPLFTLGVLVGLFGAFLAVHEAGVSIGESAIHAAYWAALGASWLLPEAVQAWSNKPCRHPMGSPDGPRDGPVGREEPGSDVREKSAVPAQ